MEALASRWSALLADLNDLRVHIEPARLREIVAECTAALDGKLAAGEEEPLHSILALAYYRLGETRRQLVHTRAIARLRPDDVLAQRNYGGSLIEVGQLTEGISVMEEAANLPSPHRSRTLGDLAFAYTQARRWDDALAAFTESVRVADYTSERDLMSLAAHGAQLGFRQQSLEFLARYLQVAHGVELGERTAPDVVRDVAANHPEWLWFVAGVPPLRLVILQALTVDPLLAGHIPWDHFSAEIITTESAQSAEDVFATMKPLSDEATLAVLRDGGDGDGSK
ncbi:hypothetical protein [Archangium lansingense]|uniref:Tetratricopeptide repeat protein n=1 Tax=Archangium lansingense TaxID=2995310 RepID=A0ABT4AN40_9BACT|nr:hypothetical protein [Archangium lansinium]MCY1083123.1 hypothetical protein [Archangium lansinium]